MKLTVMELAAQIVAAPLAAAMMRYSSWYPLALSSLLLVFGAFLAIRLPDTRPPGLDTSVSMEPDDEYYHEREDKFLFGGYRKYLSSMGSIWTGSIVLLLLVFFGASFGTQTLQQQLLQYTSKKFRLGYRKVGGLATFALFALQIPHNSKG